MCRLILITLIALLPTAAGALGLIEGTAGNRLRGKVIAPIANPWAMTFVTPRHLLVTAKTGAVWLVSTDGRKTAVAGAAAVAFALGDAAETAARAAFFLALILCMSKCCSLLLFMEFDTFEFISWMAASSALTTRSRLSPSLEARSASTCCR